MPITISLLLVLEAHLLSELVVSCEAFDKDGAHESKVGWVWDVGTRSTFDILWSCLTVVLVCTYKVIHLNVPAEEEWSPRWYELLYWRKWLRKLKWMGLMALSPELLLSMAMRDWLWSRDSVRKFEQAGLKDKSSLLCHSKTIADIIERSEDSKTTPKTQSMPSHIPLRYAQI